ncbi:unnamed protein product [Rhodiola kirilowii]
MEDDNVDLLDGHAEEDKTPAEANRKRKLKTPAQLQALEDFYAEHKYPTESMKAEIAEKVGLTEKQVSGWFCHRRLKDKRLSKDEADGSGRVDRSSGVIQEPFSGPGQDSCGSTKPGEYNKRVELREVESQWLACQDFSPVSRKCSNMINTASLDVDTDGTSSESSSPLHPSHLPQSQVPRTLDNSRYFMQNGAVLPSKPKVATGTQSRRPSGYLKIIPKSEHPAITAVKKRLGNNFCEDGPPLGIEFQPPPTGAFQAAPRDTITGPRNEADSLPRNISERGYPGGYSRLKMRNGIFRGDDSYLEEQGPTVNHVSEAFYSHRHSKPKPSIDISNKLHHGWDLSNKDRYYAEETYTSKDFPKGSKYDSKALRIQPISSIHTEKLTTDQTDVSLHNISYANPILAQRSKQLKNDFSNTKLRKREPQDTSEGRLPEIGKLVSVSSNISNGRNHGKLTVTPDYELMDERLPAAMNDPLKYPNPLGVKVVVDNELKDKKAQFGYPQPDFPKATLAINRGRGDSEEMSSSFSEDETVDTSTSEMSE